MLYFSAGTEIDGELCGGHLSHREQDGNLPLDPANRSQEVGYTTQCSDPETSLGCTEWVCTQDSLLLSWRLGNAKETHSPLPIGLLEALSVLPSQHRYGPVYDSTNSKGPWSFPYPCAAVVSNPAAGGLQRPSVREPEVWRPPGQLNLPQSSCPLSQPTQDSPEVSFLQGVSERFVMWHDVAGGGALGGPRLRHLPPLEVPAIWRV